MELIIKNRIITEPIINILTKLRRDSNHRYLRDIKSRGKDIVVTCPMHKDGQESHPSCFVHATRNNAVEYGTVHCFTCGYKAPLFKLVAFVLNISDDEAKTWLLDNCSSSFIEEIPYLEEIDLDKTTKTQNLDLSILSEYNYYHPYMWTRKLTKQVVDMFSVGFDPKAQAITFPVWDEHNNLKMITSRSVNTKNFHIDENVEKPVYLLNFINNWNIDQVWVAESQINALYLWSMGFPAIALIGTGSKNQYNILNKSGIRTYHLCFDGDQAGDKAIERFKKNIRKDCFIDVIKLPRGKDVNDLSFEEFMSLETIW